MGPTLRVGICFLLAAGGLARPADEGAQGILARVVVHPDGRRTETVRSAEARTVETITRAPDGIVISREKVQLNAAGDPVYTFTYDAQGSLLYRTVHAYDNMGRKTGERTFNRKGRKVRDMIQGYDENGKAKKPVVMNYPDPDSPKVPDAPMAPVLTPQGKIRQTAPPASTGKPGTR